jgi:hypothetical protein
MRVPSLFLFLIAAFLTSERTASAENFYLLRRGTLSVQRATNADPKSPDIEEWQIRLYPNGMTPNATGSSYWGIITGSSIESVKRQLEENQKWELFYNKWSGRVEDNYTYVNPFGPIAVLKGEYSTSNDALSSRLAMADQVSGLIEGFEKARDVIKAFNNGESEASLILKLANLDPKERKMGDAFKKYVRLLKSLRERAAQAGQKIQAIGASSNWVEQLKEFDNRVEQAKQYVAQIRQSTNQIKVVGPSNWKNQIFPPLPLDTRTAEQIEQHVVISNGRMNITRHTRHVLTANNEVFWERPLKWDVPLTDIVPASLLLHLQTDVEVSSDTSRILFAAKDDDTPELLFVDSATARSAFEDIKALIASAHGSAPAASPNSKTPIGVASTNAASHSTGAAAYTAIPSNPPNSALERKNLAPHSSDQMPALQQEAGRLIRAAEAQRLQWSTEQRSTATSASSSSTTASRSADAMKALNDYADHMFDPPVGRTVPGQPGYVFSPFDSQGLFPLDVRSFSSGARVIDPYTKKEFFVP